MAKLPNTTPDNVVADLRAAIESSRVKQFNESTTKFIVIDKDQLMQELCIFIAKRDQKILEHGIEVGKGKHLEAKNGNHKGKEKRGYPRHV